MIPTPANQMKIINLIYCLSSVSAAFISLIPRSIAVEINRKRVKLSELDITSSLPWIPSVPNPFPVSYCEKDPKKLTTVPLVSKPRDLGKYEGFKPNIYEEMLSSHDFDAVSDAYKNDAIDFNYFPNTKYFFLVFLDDNCIKGNEIMKKYFESGVIDKMVEFGSFSYQDVIEFAVYKNNFYVANLALDRLIAKHRPEINSPDYKSKSSLIKSARQMIFIGAHSNDKKLPEGSLIAQNFDCMLLSPSDMEKFNFFRKYYLIYENSLMEPWLVDLSRNIVLLIFSNCNL